MKAKYLHIFTFGILAMGILFDFFQDRAKDIALEQVSVFISLGASLLFNLLFFTPLSYLILQYLNVQRSIKLRLFYIVFCSFLLLLFVPQLWFFRIPIQILPLFPLPTSPRSYFGIALSFIVTSNLLGMFMRSLRAQNK